MNKFLYNKKSFFIVLLIGITLCLLPFFMFSHLEKVKGEQTLQASSNTIALEPFLPLSNCEVFDFKVFNHFVLGHGVKTECPF